MKLSIIKDNTNWLEATWYEEFVTTEGDEPVITKKQVHCEYYSGHPEHIAMLRDKAAAYGTILTEFEGLITEVGDNFVLEPEPHPAVPSQVSKKQAKWYLVDLELYETVSAAIPTMGLKAQIAWTDADFFGRNDPLIIEMAAALGWHEDEIDQFFIEASKL